LSSMFSFSAPVVESQLSPAALPSVCVAVVVVSSEAETPLV